jgi:hypothetical protein
MQLGAKACFESVNSAGGVNGLPIVLHTLDGGYEPARCKANTEKFIQDDVFALFGFVGTPTSLAALPLANQAKLPFIAPLTGADGLREPFNKLVFHVRASYMDETELIVKQLTELGLKKIAVFHQGDAYGQAGLVGVQRALARRKLTPTAVATVERNSTDVGLAVKTLAAAQPEAIVQISAYKSCAGLHTRGPQGRLRRPVLQRVLRGHAGAGRRAGQGRGRRGRVPGDALALRRRRGPGGRLPARAQEAGPQGRTQLHQHRGLHRRPRGGGRAQAHGPAHARALVGALETLPAYESRGYQLRFGPSRHVGSSFVELSMLTADGRSAADRPAA